MEKGRKKDRNTKKYPFLFCLKRQKKFKFSQIHKYILFDLFLFVRFLAEGDRKKLPQAEIIIKIYQISLVEDEQEKEKKCRKNTISAIISFL